MHSTTKPYCQPSGCDVQCLWIIRCTDRHLPTCMCWVGTLPHTGSPNSSSLYRHRRVRCEISEAAYPQSCVMSSPQQPLWDKESCADFSRRSFSKEPAQRVGTAGAEGARVLRSLFHKIPQAVPCVSVVTHPRPGGPRTRVKSLLLYL